ncbi:MAG: SMP-30/gluconolactonase/LRE family protein [Rhizobiaceae bacterium]|nr:SMP-30/gluconolactonase/LRE family protein [Rhizobiaceae bacterium]
MSFYAPPTDIFARVWVDLPARLGWTRRMNPLVEKFVGKPAHSFLEGPSFDTDGNLYVVNFAFGEIIRITPEGEPSVICTYDGAPNGLQVGPDGMIYVSDRLRGIMRLDTSSGRIELLCGPERSPVGFVGPSDIAIAGNGDIYFTDQGDSHLLEPTGRAFRFSASGKLDLLMEGLPGPNGITLDPTENYLFVALTYGPAVWRGRIRPDGAIDKVGVFQTLPGGYSGTDGLAMDEKGGLAACHNRLGTVWLFDPDGAPVYRVRSPADAGRKITNVAYGGPGNAQLFMTEAESGKILIADAPVPGLVLPGQRRKATTVRA